MTSPSSFTQSLSFSDRLPTPSEPFEDSENFDEEEFAFQVAPNLSDITADELFDNGLLLPLYPVFGRATAPSSPDNRPSGDFCHWSPSSAPHSPERPIKSPSTGTAKRWKLRDLVVGRSHSDGKEKFVFIDTNTSRPPKPAMPESKKARVPANSGKGVTGNKRKSFLPYRQNLLGFFGGVNAFSANHHPY